MIKVRDYHLGMVPDLPGDLEELVGLAGDAGRLSAILEEAELNLRARGMLQSAA